jgi:hypothetical protein
MPNGFGMCAVAVRDQCDGIDVAASFLLSITDEFAQFQGFALRAGGTVVIGLVTFEIKPNRDGRAVRTIRTSWVIPKTMGAFLGGSQNRDNTASL